MPRLPVIAKCNGRYMLTHDWTPPYCVVPIPAGFEFDGMSSPALAWVLGIGSQDAHQLAASCAHDHQYGPDGRCDRKQADTNLYRNLRAFGEPSWRCKIIYSAVRGYGKDHYQGKGNPE